MAVVPLGLLADRDLFTFVGLYARLKYCRYRQRQESCGVGVVNVELRWHILRPQAQYEAESFMWRC